MTVIRSVGDVMNVRLWNVGAVRRVAGIERSIWGWKVAVRYRLMMMVYFSMAWAVQPMIGSAQLLWTNKTTSEYNTDTSFSPRERCKPVNESIHGTPVSRSVVR